MRAVAGRCVDTGLRSAGRLVAYLRPNPQDPTACLGLVNQSGSRFHS